MRIAVVILDTLRKDSFEEFFDWVPGERFERAYSTANWTVPAHASLFTGHYASEIGTHSKHLEFDAAVPSVAERLSEAGFGTRGFSANPNITANRRFDRGFDQFQSPARFAHLNSDSIPDWSAFARRHSDRSLLYKGVRAIRESLRDDIDTIPALKLGLQMFLREETFGNPMGCAEVTDLLQDWSFATDEFLFVNVMEMHEPYEAPEAYRTVESPPTHEAVGDIIEGTFDPEHVRRGYRDCARYLSDAYAELFDRLTAEFDYVITTADHGELLGEYDMWGHEYGVFPELTHVPLRIYGDGFSGSTHTPVSLLDVHATILSLAGLEQTESRGTDLREIDSSTEREFITEFLGLTPWSERRLREGYPDATLDRYDAELLGLLTDRGYAYQTRDGFVDDGIEAAEDRLATLVDGIERSETRESGDPSEDILEQLKDLGYA